VRRSRRSSLLYLDRQPYCTTLELRVTHWSHLFPRTSLLGSGLLYVHSLRSSDDSREALLELPGGCQLQPMY
jgi:hypothetical protein